MRGSIGMLLVFTVVSITVGGCGDRNEASNFSAESCLVSFSPKTAVLGQPIHFVVQLPTKEKTEAILWKYPTAEWVAEFHEGELRFADDTQMVKVSSMQPIAQSGSQVFRIVYDINGFPAGLESRQLFKRPGKMVQSFNLPGDSGCRAEVEVPLAVTQAYQDDYWARH